MLSLLKAFPAQWGSSQIKRHLYCRVVSAIINTAWILWPHLGASSECIIPVRGGKGDYRVTLMESRNILGSWEECFSLVSKHGLSKACRLRVCCVAGYSQSSSICTLVSRAPLL